MAYNELVNELFKMISNKRDKARDRMLDLIEHGEDKDFFCEDGKHDAYTDMVNFLMDRRKYWA